MAITDRFQGYNIGVAVKPPCTVASTASLTLSGAQTIDGISIGSCERVLVKSQTNAKENGIYLADTSGWRRAADWDGRKDAIPGTYVYVDRGTAFGRVFFAANSSSTAVSIDIGATGDDVTFSQITPSLTDVSAATVQADGSTAERALDIRFSDTIHIDDYGAVPSSTAIAETTLAVQSAVDRGSSLGRKVVGSEGTYWITDLNIARDNLSFSGANFAGRDEFNAGFSSSKMVGTVFRIASSTGAIAARDPGNFSNKNIMLENFAVTGETDDALVRLERVNTNSFLNNCFISQEGTGSGLYIDTCFLTQFSNIFVYKSTSASVLRTGIGIEAKSLLAGISMLSFDLCTSNGFDKGWALGKTETAGTARLMGNMLLRNTQANNSNIGYHVGEGARGTEFINIYAENFSEVGLKVSRTAQHTKVIGGQLISPTTGDYAVQIGDSVDGTKAEKTSITGVYIVANSSGCVLLDTLASADETVLEKNWFVGSTGKHGVKLNSTSDTLCRLIDNKYAGFSTGDEVPEIDQYFESDVRYQTRQPTLSRPLVKTISDTETLPLTSQSIFILTPSGADRNVSVPDLPAGFSRTYTIRHPTSSTHDLVVIDSSSNTIAQLTAFQTAEILGSTLGWTTSWVSSST